MIIELPKLDTKESLKFALELNSLIINEPLLFSANMDWVRPFGMLYGGMAIKHFLKKNSHISVSMDWNSEKQSVTYAGHMGFFKFISPYLKMGKMPGEASGNDNYLPITELDFDAMHRNEINKGNFIELGSLIEKESAKLSKILSRNNKELQILLTYLLREVLRNIPEHSNSNKAWICGQYWANNTAEIAIIDEGIGIKNSLQKNVVHKKYILDDENALRYSVKAGISQAFQPAKKNKSDEVWANSGFGLFMVSEICKELDGSFCLASGNKYLKIKSNGKIKVGDTNYAGTAVRITISTLKLSTSKAIIQRIAEQGEEQAKAIRNAFKKASMPSKGLLI